MGTNAKKMKVFFDTTPTQTGHANRGIGMYARMLYEELKKMDHNGTISLVDSPTNAEILHIPTFDLFRPTFPYRYLLSKKKLIVTIHDVIPLLFPDKYPVGIKGKCAFFLQKNALRFVSHIITDSIASQQDIHTHLGVPLSKITPIYLAAGISQPELPIDDAKNIIAQYKLPKKFVLYVGDINYNKNIPNLIESVNNFPNDISLICVGRNFKPQPIPEWQAIENALHKLKNVSKVRFITDLGIDATKEMAALYQLAFAYIQPSYYEGFGLPVLEAMQYGTPTIVAKNSSLIEIGGKAALFVEPTASGISEGVMKIYELSAQRRTEISRQSKQWAKQFSWEKTAQETVQVYQTSI